MPQKSGFFDTTADDPREYPSREFAEYFARFVGNGVFGGGEKLKVTATGKDMNVSINLGYGWINGYMYSVFDTPLVLPIQQATTQDRIDRIILRLDVSTPVRAVKAIVLQGNPATTPQAPAIVRTGDIFDLSIAQVVVKANTSTIQPYQVTDERLNNQVCGIVTGVIQQADTTAIFNEFQSWLKTKTAEYQKQWDDFIKDIQDKGFATTQYVDQKAEQAESNAKNASVPRSGGTINGNLAVTNILTVAGRNITSELDSVKQSGVSAKQGLVDALNAVGISASINEDWASLNAKVGQGKVSNVIYVDVAESVSNGESIGVVKKKHIATIPANTNTLSFFSSATDHRSDTHFFSAVREENKESYIRFFIMDKNGTVVELHRRQTFPSLIDVGVTSFVYTRNTGKVISYDIQTYNYDSNRAFGSIMSYISNGAVLDSAGVWELYGELSTNGGWQNWSMKGNIFAS
ncbi:hypothetical protein M3661_16935 [Paenibacillus sp. MER 180]|uniref:hypothetical protein n=1 Tax=Paenibacillus sp. MER 180 TaxID=2939570 RepID=UPI00203C3EE6|nr:hypothetical protein [Paenibacillus sp. MER 180]MCM3291817.1 hypothetical protein [Paenibacillus sp. MER 180]